MNQLFDLTGKVVAIIGAASGIGEAVARGARELGAVVEGFDIRNLNGRAPLDIREGAQVERALIDVRDRHQRLDAVICTPSINVRKKILDYADDDVDRVLTLNLKGTFNVLRAAGRIMTADRRGSIVLFSSIRSQVVEPGQSVYAATKAGILQMARAAAARAAAAEFGPYGVRVNAVAPGVIETPLTAPIKSNEAWYNAYADKSVFKRWGQPEEMVGPTLFLVSYAASYVTGTLLVADGGWLAADGRFTPPGM
jgi:NAD(P)-dependent dehydrogenase (short-subunit alcohol dehydrogenase family)